MRDALRHLAANATAALVEVRADAAVRKQLITEVSLKACAQDQRRTFEVLGVNVDLVQIPEVIAQVQKWIEDGHSGHYVTFSNVHAIMEAYHDSAFREVLSKASIVCPDGMPLVWLSRLRGFGLRRRVYGPDFMRDFIQATQDKDHSHFFYGGAPGIAEQLSTKLREHFPRLRVAGMYSPSFRALSATERDEIVGMINQSHTDVLWVALGCPKQEQWMYEHRELLNVPVMLGVGQAFDIYAGTLQQAPRWIRESGFEWLFRLCLEPRRLWRRYLVHNTGFLIAIVREFVTRKK